ncbi:MAG: alpha/beta fold hydrolase [Parvibaculaceae bacterium]
MPTIKLGDLNFYYERKGPEAGTDGKTAAPMLFISGSGGDLRVRPGIMDGPFPKHFDTLAYDQRGLGQSAKPDVAYSMADYADDAAKLMDAMGWDKAHVVGMSFGGMVALEFACRHLSRIDRLVLACTSPGGAGGASYPLHEVVDMEPEARARHMIPIIDTRRTAEWAAANPDQYAMFLQMAMNDPYKDEEGRAMGYRRQLEARAAHDTWDRLSGITCPTLVCGGKYDGQATPEAQEKMMSRLPNATLRMFEGGHMFMVQDREAFPAMVGFLEG